MVPGRKLFEKGVEGPLWTESLLFSAILGFRLGAAERPESGAAGDSIFAVALLGVSTYTTNYGFNSSGAHEGIMAA